MNLTKLTLNKTWVVILLLPLVLLSGCSKKPVKIISAQIVTNMDKGAGLFDRVLKVCFSNPLSSDYYHKVKIVTDNGFVIAGGNWLRPMASDPSNKCQYRNIYSYIGKNSPPNAHQMIKDYVKPGHIHQLLIQVYDDKPVGKEIPVDEKLFKDL